MTVTSTPMEEIPNIVDGLRQYFGTQVTKSYEWRVKQINGLIRLLMENEEAIVDALRADLRKPRFETFSSEITSTVTELRSMLHELRGLMKPTPVESPLLLLPCESFTQPEPFGVVLIIGSFNYPIQLTLMPLLAALAAGNCAILKPSEMAHACATLLATLLPRYVDSQAVRVVQGSIAETTTVLAQRFDYIFFTGSEAVGKVVLRAAAEHLTPVTLELGGKSPVIVDETADLVLSARRIAWGKCFNTGQSCIAPDYVFVHESVKDKLVALLKQELVKFYGADPKRSDDFGRIVNERHTLRLKALLEAHQADIVHGGEVDVAERYVAPTILLVDRASKVMQEEIFGPILPILTYTNLSSVIDYVNSRPKPLALYLFSGNARAHDDVLARTSSGGVTINDCMMHFSNPNLPFGGVGASGLGRYHGKYGFATFSHTKSVLKKSVYGDSPARYPPYTAGNLKLIRFISEIYRVNSGTFSRVFAWLVLPILLAVLAQRFGPHVFMLLRARL